MSAHDASETDGAVFRLIYRSRSRIDADERSKQLAAIFTTARRNNRGHEITGALMVTDSAFVQALEGVEDEVRELFGHIEHDERHDEVTVVDETTAPRTFGRWAMAQVPAGDGPDTRLASNASAGELVQLGRDPSITAEQERVLSFMRDTARA